jgi:four helix bundle protein
VSLVSSFPKEERYGITSQITRSAVSIPSNVAEGSSQEQKMLISFMSKLNN